jgi:hypothetical protein
MGISFLVYFFGDLLKVMRYIGKAFVTQGVIPRCIGTERAQTQLLDYGYLCVCSNINVNMKVRVRDSK